MIATAVFDDLSLDGDGKEVLRLGGGLADVSFRFDRHDYTGDMLSGARAVSSTATSAAWCSSSGT